MNVRATTGPRSVLRPNWTDVIKKCLLACKWDDVDDAAFGTPLLLTIYSWGEHDGGQVLLGLTRRLTGVA